MMVVCERQPSKALAFNCERAHRDKSAQGAISNWPTINNNNIAVFADIPRSIDVDSSKKDLLRLTEP